MTREQLLAGYREVERITKDFDRIADECRHPGQAVGIATVSVMMAGLGRILAAMAQSTPSAPVARRSTYERMRLRRINRKG